MRSRIRWKSKARKFVTSCENQGGKTMNSLVQSQQALGIVRPSSTFGDADWLAPLGVHISRYALVLILFWIGIQKFTLAEAEGIRVFTMHSAFVSWTYSFLSVRAAASLVGTVVVPLPVLSALTRRDHR